MRHPVLALLALIALSGLAPESGIAATPPAPAPTPDSTHPVVMQQAALQVATARTGVLKPFVPPPPQPAVGGAGRLQREVFGFALASSLSDPTIGYPTWDFSLLSTVAFFGLHVQDDGTFASDSGLSVWNSSQTSGLISVAHAHATKVVLTVILQDFSPGTPHMCSGLLHAFTTATNAVAEIAAKGVDGVNLDYEGLNGSCGTSDPSWARHSFTNFAAALRPLLPAGSYLSVDTYASSAVDPLGFFDVTSLQPLVDSYFVMAYDLEYSNYSRYPTSCANFCLGPTAPLTTYYYNDTTTASQYVAAVPASKVILGVPYYGRKACVPAPTPNQNPISDVVADAYTDASTEVSTPGLVQPGSYVAHRDTNDPAGQVRWDTWINPSLNCIRELYWDDATSLVQKYTLVDTANLRGVGIWNLNYGGGAPELWNALAVKFAYVPTAPGNVTAYSQDSAAAVNWSPATSLGGPIVNYTVLAAPGGATTTVAGSVQTAVVHGLTNGTSYTFTVTASNSYGPGIASAVSNAVVPAKPAVAWYFPWYDNATPGIQSDYFAVANPGPNWANVLIQLPGAAPLSFGVPHGTAKYLSFPPGTAGGPVMVTTDGEPVVVSQRVVYYSSANERAAVPAAALSTSLSWPWYDWATAGFESDYFYVGNPGATAANVTISLPGTTALHLTLAAGSAGYRTFPHGTAGGPVTLSSDQPVLASQRVLFMNSFTDIPASLPSSAGTQLVFPVYYWASPDFGSDYFYVANPGASPAHVTISLPGVTPIQLTVAAGSAGFRTFPYGTAGGPVRVSSDQPVLASQRVLYNQSAMETPASLASSAATSFHFPVYYWDGPDLQSDYFYVTNPGPNWANVLISMPGAPLLSFGVPHGTTKAVTWPRGTGGGPVTVTTDGEPVLISQRTVFDQSAWEFTAPLAS